MRPTWPRRSPVGAGFWSALAEEQGRDAAYRDELDGPVTVRVPSQDLEAALDALFGNVFAHPPNRPDTP